MTEYLIFPIKYEHMLRGRELSTGLRHLEHDGILLNIKRNEWFTCYISYNRAGVLRATQSLLILRGVI